MTTKYKSNVVQWMKLICYTGKKKSISIIWIIGYLNKHFRIFFWFVEVHFFYRLNNVEKIPDNEKKKTKFQKSGSKHQKNVL